MNFQRMIPRLDGLGRRGPQRFGAMVGPRTVKAPPPAAAPGDASAQVITTGPDGRQYADASMRTLVPTDRPEILSQPGTADEPAMGMAPPKLGMHMGYVKTPDPALGGVVTAPSMGPAQQIAPSVSQQQWLAGTGQAMPVAPGAPQAAVQGAGKKTAPSPMAVGRAAMARGGWIGQPPVEAGDTLA